MKAFFEQFKLYFYAGLIAVGLAMIIGGFFFGRHVESLENAKDREKERIEWQAKVDAERDRLDTISARLEEKIGNIQVVHTTINRRVEKEIEKQIYNNVDCAIPDTGVDIINQNASDLNATRKVQK